jgi:hypothetical protein
LSGNGEAKAVSDDFDDLIASLDPAMAIGPAA